MQCRMFQQAVDDIDRAIRMEPKEPLYHAERAVVYYRLGEFEEALKSAQKSAELNPKVRRRLSFSGNLPTQIKNQREKAPVQFEKSNRIGRRIRTSHFSRRNPTINLSFFPPTHIRPCFDEAWPYTFKYSSHPYLIRNG